MTDYDLSTIPDSVLAVEVARRLSTIDKTDAIRCRSTEIKNFVEAIVGEIGSSLLIMDDLISEFTKQKEDLEHQLSIMRLNGSITKEEQEDLTKKITDGIVLRRIVKNARLLSQSFRDILKRIPQKVQEVENLSYGGKSVVQGPSADGLLIEEVGDTDYRDHITHVFTDTVNAIALHNRTSSQAEIVAPTAIADVDSISQIVRTVRKGVTLEKG